MAGKNDDLAEKFGELSMNQACKDGCCEIYENESTHTKQRLGDEPILGNLHEFCAAFYHTHEWGFENTKRGHQCLDKKRCIISKRAKKSKPPNWKRQPKTVAAVVKFENEDHIVYEAKYTNCANPFVKKHAEDFFRDDLNGGMLNEKLKIEENRKGTITMYLTLQPCNESTSAEGTGGTLSDQSCCKTLKKISKTLKENGKDISLRIKVTNTNHLRTSEKDDDCHKNLRKNAVKGIKKLMDEGIIKFSAMDEEDWHYLFSMTTGQPSTEGYLGTDRAKLDQENRVILKTIAGNDIDTFLNSDINDLLNDKKCK